MLSIQWATFDVGQKTGCMVVSMQNFPFIIMNVRGGSDQMSHHIYNIKKRNGTLKLNVDIYFICILCLCITE